MLRFVHIWSFKGFRDTHIGPLRKVNLILGGQNVGKTSLLEAIYAGTTFDASGATSVFRAGEDKDSQWRIEQLFGPSFGSIRTDFGEGGLALWRSGRNFPGQERPDFVFLGEGYNLKFGRGGVGSNSASRKALPISLYLPGQLKQIELFSQVLIAQKKDALIRLLGKVEPRLLDVNIAMSNGAPQLFVSLRGESVSLPISQLGHGFNRLLYLFCALMVTESKLALIDEVENGIHYSALPTLLQGIKNIAQDDQVQTLMTTHSWDCIRACCEVFADSPADFQGIRLEREDAANNIRAVYIEGEHLLRMVEEDMEVR